MARSLAASLPGGEVTGNVHYTLFNFRFNLLTKFLTFCKFSTFQNFGLNRYIAPNIV